MYIYIHVRISKARGTSTSKLLMTEVEGSLFGIYTDFTMVHIIYTILRGHTT